MFRIIYILICLCASGFTYAQSPADLTGLRFEQLDKNEDASSVLQFFSNKQAVYIMSGKSLYSGRRYSDQCPCTVTVNKTAVTIRCICDDRDIYPDPIEDAYIYDNKMGKLTSTRYKYSSGSAPSPEWTMKFIVWNQLGQ